MDLYKSGDTSDPLQEHFPSYRIRSGQRADSNDIYVAKPYADLIGHRSGISAADCVLIVRSRRYLTMDVHCLESLRESYLTIERGFHEQLRGV
jgi:hypothetical protein